MGEFVSVIAALPRIVTLHDVTIQTAGKGYDQLAMDVTAKTYRYLDDQEVAAADGCAQEAGSGPNDETSHAIAGAGVAGRLFVQGQPSSNAFIEQTKQEQPGGVEPLPEIKPNETYTYDGASRCARHSCRVVRAMPVRRRCVRTASATGNSSRPSRSTR